MHTFIVIRKTHTLLLLLLCIHYCTHRRRMNHAQEFAVVPNGRNTYRRGMSNVFTLFCGVHAQPRKLTQCYRFIFVANYRCCHDVAT